LWSGNTAVKGGRKKIYPSSLRTITRSSEKPYKRGKNFSSREKEELNVKLLE
jgi:hypothetical protein